MVFVSNPEVKPESQRTRGRKKTQRCPKKKTVPVIYICWTFSFNSTKIMILDHGRLLSEKVGSMNLHFAMTLLRSTPGVLKNTHFKARRLNRTIN